MDPQQSLVKAYFDCIPQENKHKLDWKLDQEHGATGVQKHLGSIANAMDEWKGPVADVLGLTKGDVASINNINGSLSLQTRAVLQKWKEKSGFKATYRTLIKAFLTVQKPEYAAAVCKVLGGTPGQESNVSTQSLSLERNSASVEDNSDSNSMKVGLVQSFSTLVNRSPDKTSYRRKRGNSEQDFSDPAEFVPRSLDIPHRIDTDSSGNSNNDENDDMDHPSTDDEHYQTCDSSDSDSYHHGDVSSGRRAENLKGAASGTSRTPEQAIQHSSFETVSGSSARQHKKKMASTSVGKPSAREIATSPMERVISQVLDAFKEDDGAKVLAVIKSRGGFDVNTFIKGDKTPLMLAASLDSKQVAKVLLDNNASVNAKDEDDATPLFLAVTNGNYEIMKLLVQAGSNVNQKAKDIPMLLEPSAKGFSMIVQYLLENGARPNITDKDGQSPLMAAAGNGQKDVVMVLLTHGADVTLVNKKTSSNALQEAIEGGHTDVVVLLMKATTEARKKSDRLFTCKTSEEVRQLIKDGAKVDQRRGDDATPLMVQAQAGNLEVVQELIRSGANVDLQDDLGQTALMKASEGGHFGVVQTLVTSRAILDLKTRQGETALMLTTRRKNVHIVKELLLAGADPSARDKVGQSVYDIAKGQGSDDIIEALKKHSTVSNKSSPLVQILSSYFQEKESAAPKTTPLKSRRPGSAKSASTLIKKSSGGLKPLVARGVAKEDRDESVMKSELDKAWKRVADLETRVHELTLKTTMELPADQEDLSYLERGRLEEEYRKLKELKKKSETYSIEAKQTAQRLGAENFKLKEQLSQEKHLSDITQHNLKREIDDMKLEVKRGASSSDLAAIKAEVFEEEVTSRAYQLLRKMPKPTWAMAQSTNASFDLRPEAVCDIILHHSVRACLVQLVIGGLPYSGKSTLLQNMLPQEAAKREEVPGLKIYEAVMMNDMVDDQALGNWVPFVKDGAELLSLAAALAQVCAKQTALPSDLIGQSSTSVLEQVVERMFPTSSINEHFYKSYTCLKDLLVKMEKKGDLYKLLYTTLTFVNIWDIGLNKAVYEILVLMANKCDNLLLVNVLDLKRDGQNLDKPLDLKDTEVYNGRYSNRKDEERVLRRHSAGDYFTRFVTACNPSNNTTLLVGTHEDSFQEDELEDAVFEVEQGVLDRARGMGVADCVHDKMLAVDATSPEGGKTVCGAVESMIKHERRFLIDIPVAWIFFRCVLQATGKFFMGRNDMLTVAMECGLKNEAEFEKWLTTFQKCSSIFYSPDKNLVSLHDNVILRPIEFVRCLDRLYYAEFDEELAQKTSLKEDLKLLKNGLLTETLARELWQDEVCDRNTERSSQHQRCELLLKVLQDLEASVCIPATMCSELTEIKSRCFFLPSLRQEVCVTPPTDHTHSLFVQATGVCTIQHQLQNQFISRFQSHSIQVVPGNQYNVLKMIWYAETTQERKEDGKMATASAAKSRTKQAEVIFYFMEDKLQVTLSIDLAVKRPRDVSDHLCSLIKTTCIELFHNATQEVPRFEYSLTVTCPSCDHDDAGGTHFAVFNPLLYAPVQSDVSSKNEYSLSCDVCEESVVKMTEDDPRSMWLRSAYKGSMNKVYKMKDSLSQNEIVEVEQFLHTLKHDDKIALAEHMGFEKSEVDHMTSLWPIQSLPLNILLEWRRRHPVGNKRMLAKALYSCGHNKIAGQLDSTVLSPKLKHKTMTSSSLATKPGFSNPPLQFQELATISASIASKWKDLGIELNIPTHQLDSIEAGHPKSPTRCAMEMLQYWLNNSVGAGRENLSKALSKIGHHNLADVILLGTSNSDTVMLK